MLASAPSPDARTAVRSLILDTCGDPATIALTVGEGVLWQCSIPGRSASAETLTLLSEGLQRLGWTMADLDGIGVVHGPGSFTGMRVGLAIAKGLCLAAGRHKPKPLATVSRLEVLLENARRGAAFPGPLTAVLHAGRGELYAQRSKSAEDRGSESLVGLDALASYAQGSTVVIAEENLKAALADLNPHHARADAAAALPLVLRSLADGGTSVALADAHYVRAPEQTFVRPARCAPEPIAG